MPTQVLVRAPGARRESIGNRLQICWKSVGSRFGELRKDHAGEFATDVAGEFASLRIAGNLQPPAAEKQIATYLSNEFHKLAFSC